MNYYVSILKKRTLKFAIIAICFLIIVCNLSFAESPQYYSNVANTMCDYREHYPTVGKPNAFIALEAFGVIVKTCSDIFYTIGQKKCPMPSAKIRNYSHSHNLMSQ